MGNYAGMLAVHPGKLALKDRAWGEVLRRPALAGHAHPDRAMVAMTQRMVQKALVQWEGSIRQEAGLKMLVDFAQVQTMVALKRA